MFKLIACLLMLIDHLGHFFQPVLPPELYLLMRGLGRLAFPLFAYSLVLGKHRSRRLGQYAFRLILFALLTQLSLNFVPHLPHLKTNILFSFSFGLLFLIGFDLIFNVQSTIQRLQAEFSKRFPRLDLSVPKQRYGTAVALLLFSGAGFALLDPDYGFYGLTLLILMDASVHPQLLKRFDSPLQSYRAYQDYKPVALLLLLLNGLAALLALTTSSFSGGLPQTISVFSLFLLPIERSEKPASGKVRLAFYLFYPLHLVVLGLIRWLTLFVS